MLMANFLRRAALVGMFLLATATAASAQNVLTNPGFESGLAGWIPFGNAYPEAVNPPAIVPLSGNGVAKMFGNFSGGFDVTGIFQEFPTVPGEAWEMSSNARHFSGDPMVGAGAPNDNWVVQKMAFFDAGNNEIGSAESTILDGTYATDVWFPSGLVQGTAPAGTVKVQLLILYLQPVNDGGAALIDDCYFAKQQAVPVEPATWGAIKSTFVD